MTVLAAATATDAITWVMLVVPVAVAAWDLLKHKT